MDIYSDPRPCGYDLNWVFDRSTLKLTARNIISKCGTERKMV